MSKHPNSESKKPWTTPTVKEINLKTRPYAEVIDILHSLLDQTRKDIALHPDDRQAMELERSVRRQIDDLEAGRHTNAA